MDEERRPAVCLDQVNEPVEVGGQRGGLGVLLVGIRSNRGVAASLPHQLPVTLDLLAPETEPLLDEVEVGLLPGTIDAGQEVQDRAQGFNQLELRGVRRHALDVERDRVLGRLHPSLERIALAGHQEVVQVPAFGERHDPAPDSQRLAESRRPAFPRRVRVQAEIDSLRPRQPLRRRLQPTRSPQERHRRLAPHREAERIHRPLDHEDHRLVHGVLVVQMLHRAGEVQILRRGVIQRSAGQMHDLPTSDHREDNPVVEEVPQGTVLAASQHPSLNARIGAVSNRFQMGPKCSV